MIRNVRGTLTDLSPLSMVVDVSGIGYLVHTPRIDEGATLGSKVSLYTHLAIRENTHDLYGFFSKEELEMFELLIEIPKIGPKTALQIMSQADVSLLRKAALGSDAQYLSKMSGIGKKSAEKIVAGLKDKFGGEVELAPGEQSASDVIDALVTLGYSQKEARDAVQKLSPEIEGANARIKEALRLLGA